MNTLLSMRVEKTLGDMQELVDRFPEEQWHRSPSYGGWTASEVSEHIIKASSGLYRMVNGNTEPCDREPAEKIPMIENLFLDYNQKLQSPDFLIPADQLKKSEAAEAWESIKADFLAAAAMPDLTPICTDRALPGFGTFTRLEWLNFCLIHIQRHTHQLKNIYQDIEHKSSQP